MKLLATLAILFCHLHILSQSGTAGSPFTALGNARAVVTPGIYYFDLGGTTFSSYVNGNGMVLVATDYGGAPAGNLPQVTALTNTGRGILSPTVLSTLATATVASYTTSSGAINVTTSNTTILSRIVSNSTLHTGINDISINAGWNGTGQGIVRGAGSNCTTIYGGLTLNGNIHHPCGDHGALHWIPSTGAHKEIFNSDESPGTVRFNLWVQAPLVPLSVKLSGFKATLTSNNEVQLNWSTATETNSGHFLVERSLDHSNWVQITKLSAHNNSISAKAYTTIDNNPASGNNFYRLKIIDVDESAEYSNIIKVTVSANFNTQALVYPNPGRGRVYVNVKLQETVKIFDRTGADITSRINLTRLNNDLYSLDFSNVLKGIYIIKSERFSKKILIE